MESAMIFGKNRHLYGGLEPSCMDSFGVSSMNGKIELTITLPEDTYVDGQLLCTVAGAIIRSKTDGYPKDEFDGTLVANVTTNGIVEDTVNSMESIVYYAAFPYTDQGVYNRSNKNRAMYDPDVTSYLFGYDLDTKDKDPDTRVTYPDGVNNKNYSPAKMDYSTGVFNYGGWSVVEQAGVAFMPRPCMLKPNGTVDYYLDPNDYTKKVDGTSSDITGTSYQGNAMMQWPKIYTKRWEDENGIYHFRCSGTKQGDDWDCWCNYNKNDREIPYFYTGIYLTNGNTKYLKSGYKESAKDSSSVKSDFSKDWDLDTIADHMLIQDLLVMMARSTDCQTAYGNGDWDVDDRTSGTMNTKGMFWGDNDSSGTSNKNGVKVFGMEHWWGYTGRVVLGLGLNVKSGDIYLKVTSGKHDGSTATTYGVNNTHGSIDCSGYLAIGKVSSNNSGYIKSMLTTDYGRIPVAGGGSASEYECDYIDAEYSESNSDVEIISWIGGNRSHRSSNYYENGPFTIEFAKDATSNTIRRTSLSCKPSSY